MMTNMVADTAANAATITASVHRRMKGAPRAAAMAAMKMKVAARMAWVRSARAGSISRSVMK